MCKVRVRHSFGSYTVGLETSKVIDCVLEIWKVFPDAVFPEVDCLDFYVDKGNSLANGISTLPLNISERVFHREEVEDRINFYWISRAPK